MPTEPLTSCFSMNATEDFEAKLREIRINQIFKFYYGYYAIPFATLGLGFSILFIFAVIKAMKFRKVSRKCYILIINRSIGDALSSLMALILIFYVVGADVPSKDIVHLFENFFIASFWSGMISYVSLSILKLYAVARPFHYRNSITMKRCIYLCAASWAIFLAILIYALGVTVLTKIESLRDWSGCRLETCLRTMYRIRNSLVVGIYCFTIICFVLTVMYLNRARKFVNKFQNSQKSTSSKNAKAFRFPLWKLAINVGTFAGFNLFYVVTIITFIVLAGSDQCFSLRHYPTMMQAFAIVRFCLLSRIIIDPIISFFTDIQIKKSVLSMFGLKSSIKPADSRRPFRRQITEDNSSDFEIKNNKSTFSSIKKDPSTDETVLSQ